MSSQDLPKDFLQLPISDRWHLVQDLLRRKLISINQAVTASLTRSRT
jgi:hypothetical protein